jgi:hypothetical protein
VAATLLLGVAGSSFAIAKDNDKSCGTLDNDTLRKACREQKHN